MAVEHELQLRCNDRLQTARSEPRPDPCQDVARTGQERQTIARFKSTEHKCCAGAPWHNPQSFDLRQDKNVTVATFAQRPPCHLNVRFDNVLGAVNSEHVVAKLDGPRRIPSESVSRHHLPTQPAVNVAEAHDDGVEFSRLQKIVRRAPFSASSSVRFDEHGSGLCFYRKYGRLVETIGNASATRHPERRESAMTIAEFGLWRLLCRHAQWAIN